MAPLIPDGRYRIRNGEYDEMVATLIIVHSQSAVIALPAGSFEGDMWIIRNIGAGGNQVTIENKYYRGTYANPGVDSSLVGSSKRTVWTIVKVDGGMYSLQSPKGDRVWVLLSGSGIELVQLLTPTGQDNAKWTFDYLGA